MDKDITIITVVYNNVFGIELTISSVVNQTYRNIEYIVIDGGSTDGTVDKIKKHADDLSIFISEKDTGIYNAMNKGIKHATGRWILFLNSGDWLYSTKTIDEIHSYLDEDIDILYGDICFVYGDKQVIKHSDSSLINFRKYMPVFHPATLVKTDLLKENPFDESYKITADYQQLYSLFLNGYSFRKMDVIVAYFEAVTGVSNANYIEAMKENFKVRSRNNIFIWYPKYLYLLIFTHVKRLFF